MCQEIPLFVSHSSLQLKGWSYFELLLLLLLVDACKSEKRIRCTVNWRRRQSHDWPDLTNLMQPTSVTESGPSGRRQRGWKVSWNMLWWGGSDLSMNAMLHYYWRRVVARQLRDWFHFAPLLHEKLGHNLHKSRLGIKLNVFVMAVSENKIWMLAK